MLMGPAVEKEKEKEKKRNLLGVEQCKGSPLLIFKNNNIIYF